MSKSLTSVDLHHNPLGPAGLDIIARALELNKAVNISGLETCVNVFAMGNGLDANQTAFNSENPSGKYKLDLSKPWDHAIAELLRSRAVAKGKDIITAHVFM